MLRRQFLKAIAKTVAAAAVAPAVLPELITSKAQPIVAPAAFDAERMAQLVREVFEPAFYQTFEQNSFFMRFLERQDTLFKGKEKDLCFAAPS